LCGKKLGQGCSDGSECVATVIGAGGMCVDGVCCNNFGCGTCEACNIAGSEGTCSPLKNAEDPGTCDVTRASNGSGACVGKNGQGWVGAGDCLSGHCVDNICCDTACTGTCQACNLGATLGTCSTITNGDDPDNCTGTNTCSPTGACKEKNG